MRCAKCGRNKPKNPHQPSKLLYIEGLRWHQRCYEAATPSLIRSVTQISQEHTMWARRQRGQ